MKSYELTIVLAGKTSAAQKKKAVEGIRKIVEANKGKVIKEDDWGNVDFAQKVGKETGGAFISFELELESASVKELESKLRTDDNLLRYLLIKKG